MSAGGPAKRIVVIDDSGDSARLLSMLLKKLGYEVHVATDGASGVETALRVAPQIVISDVLMAGSMDGYAVARALRAETRLAGALLVAITGRSGDDARRESLEAGFDEHLVKPIDFRKLEKLLQSYE